MLKRYFLYLPLLAWMGMAHADNALKEKLEILLPGINVESMTPLDGTGLYEAVVDGEIVYFSKDGRYVFQGDVIALESRQNITENKRLEMKQKVLASLNEDDMIVFEPEKTQYTLTVFTDIDCGYCRKLHQQMSAYNDLGIKIRYMAFPRSGPDSESYDKAVNVWCADDRKQAMTDSKSGTNLATKHCDNPVRAQFEAGRKLGVTGTPALFLDSGQLLPGYIPPMRLKQILDEHA
tara:strand:+ start:1547 stop:2251 length:705 start_codon:yes stop_codon:yes gene_type:complete